MPDELPPDDGPRASHAAPDAPARDAGEPAPPSSALPPLLPFYKPSPEEQRPLPRGCHPLVFGVVMATIQFAATLYFMPSCFGGSS